VASGSTSYFHPDYLGSTSVLTNGSGVKEEDVVYYPYGETFTNTGTANVAYKYTGKELDGSTGLYFYEARYYDATLGRFISADTMVQSPTDPQAFNRYSYARNNPIIFNDPSGHFFKKIFKKLRKALNSPLGRAIGWVVNPMLFQFVVLVKGSGLVIRHA
jgi:RHS repeat-associated protein